jgi:hypothetical protein
MIVFARHPLSAAGAAVRALDSGSAQSWTSGDLALRFGVPVVLVLVGLTMFLHGRTRRSDLAAKARAEGSTGEATVAALRSASGRVLAGLLLMLVGLLLLFGVVLWRLLS